MCLIVKGRLSCGLSPTQLPLDLLLLGPIRRYFFAHLFQAGEEFGEGPVCFVKCLQVVIDLLLRHPCQVSLGHPIVHDALNVLRPPHYALIILQEVLNDVLLDISAHLGRQEMHDLREVRRALDHLVFVLRVLPDQHLDPVLDLLEIGSEQVRITFPLGDELVLDLLPQGFAGARDILERKLLD